MMDTAEVIGLLTVAVFTIDGNQRAIPDDGGGTPDRRRSWNIARESRERNANLIDLLTLRNEDD